MSRPQRFAWLALLTLAATSLAFALAGVAEAGSPTLVDRLVLAQRGLQSTRELATDPQELAEAIASASNGDRLLAAAMLTTAGIESALADRIRRNECRPLECDHRRAWGLWQSWKRASNADVWGSPDVGAQAADAARRLRSAYYTAKAAHAPFPAGMFRIYAGRRPDAPIPREALRVATFERLLRRLQ